MTPEEIEAAVADGTFLSKLAADLVVRPSSAGPGRTRVELSLPAWAEEHLTEETREMLRRQIQSCGEAVAARGL